MDVLLLADEIAEREDVPVALLRAIAQLCESRRPGTWGRLTLTPKLEKTADLWRDLSSRLGDNANLPASIAVQRNLAEKALGDGKIERAQTALTEAVDLASDDGDDSTIERLRDQGDLAFLVWDYVTTFTAYGRAVEAIGKSDFDKAERFSYPVFEAVFKDTSLVEDDGSLELGLKLLNRVAPEAGPLGDALAWAKNQTLQGKALNVRQRFGSDPETCKDSIAPFRRALTIAKPDTHRELWLELQVALAWSLLALARTTWSAEPLDQALEAIDAGLEVVGDDAPCETFAKLNFAQGNILHTRTKITGDPKYAIESDRSFQAALAYWTRDKNPVKWADIHFDRASALRTAAAYTNDLDLADGSVAAIEANLSVWDQDDEPFDWAVGQYELGLSYREAWHCGGDAKYLASAIQAFENATLVWTEDTLPNDWVYASYELGITHRIRFDESGEADQLDKAIARYEDTLRVWTRQAAAIDWSAVQNSLGLAYGRRSSLHQDEADLVGATSAFEKSLSVLSQDHHAENWFKTQTNLAQAYCELGAFRQDIDLQNQAASMLNALIERVDKNAEPDEWAGLYNSLGCAQQQVGAILGDEALILDALESYQKALTVRTRDRRPVLWAHTQTNRGNALKSLGDIRGDADYYRQAIQAHTNAVDMYSEKALASDQNIAQGNLALAEQALKKAGKDTDPQRVLH